MIRDPVYREAVKHRQAAVEDLRLIRHAVLPVGKTFGEIPKYDICRVGKAQLARASIRAMLLEMVGTLRLCPPYKKIGGPEGPPIVSSKLCVQPNPPDLRPRGSGRTVPSARR